MHYEVEIKIHLFFPCNSLGNLCILLKMYKHNPLFTALQCHFCYKSSRYQMWVCFGSFHWFFDLFLIPAIATMDWCGFPCYPKISLSSIWTKPNISVFMSSSSSWLHDHKKQQHIYMCYFYVLVESSCFKWVSYRKYTVHRTLPRLHIPVSVQPRSLNVNLEKN